MRTAATSLMIAALTSVITSTARAEIAWQENLRTAYSQAQTEGKPLLLHFYTDNCVWCDRLEAGAFQNAQVSTTVNQQFVPVKIYEANNQKLTEKFRVKSFPTDVIITTQGKVLSHSVSPQDPNQYVAMLVQTLNPAASGKVMVAAREPAAASPTGSNMAAQPTAQTATATIQMPIATPGDGANQEAQVAAPSSGLALPEQAPAKQTSGNGTQAQLAGSRQNGPTAAMDSGSLPGPKADRAVTSAGTPDAAGGVKQQPELALQGFCAVSVKDSDQWIEGNPDFGVIHLGKLYLFASEEAMDTFMADPIAYTPMLNGIDVVHFFEEQKIIPGKREWACRDPLYNRMYFFADEKSLNDFWESYDKYTDDAVRVMNQAIRDANPSS